MIVNHYFIFFFFQAEDGIRDLVRSRGLGDVYKRQPNQCACGLETGFLIGPLADKDSEDERDGEKPPCACLLYTSDAADERSSVDLGGRRIIKKKNT